MTLGPAVRRCDAFIAISRATAQALAERYPRAAERTTVALLGVAPALTAADPAETAALPDRGFVLAVGTLEPRKNLPRLVEAYRGLPAELQAKLTDKGAHPVKGRAQEVSVYSV